MGGSGGTGGAGAVAGAGRIGGAGGAGAIVGMGGTGGTGGTGGPSSETHSQCPPSHAKSGAAATADQLATSNATTNHGAIDRRRFEIHDEYVLMMLYLQ
jgi:hypothetical protein